MPLILVTASCSSGVYSNLFGWLDFNLFSLRAAILTQITLLCVERRLVAAILSFPRIPHKSSLVSVSCCACSSCCFSSSTFRRCSLRLLILLHETSCSCLVSVSQFSIRRVVPAYETANRDSENDKNTYQTQSRHPLYAHLPSVLMIIGPISTS